MMKTSRAKLTALVAALTGAVVFWRRKTSADADVAVGADGLPSDDA